MKLLRLLWNCVYEMSKPFYILHRGFQLLTSMYSYKVPEIEEEAAGIVYSFQGAKTLLLHYTLPHAWFTYLVVELVKTMRAHANETIASPLGHLEFVTARHFCATKICVTHKQFENIYIFPESRNGPEYFSLKLLLGSSFLFPPKVDCSTSATGGVRFKNYNMQTSFVTVQSWQTSAGNYILTR